MQREKCLQRELISRHVQPLTTERGIARAIDHWDVIEQWSCLPMRRGAICALLRLTVRPGAVHLQQQHAREE